MLKFHKTAIICSYAWSGQTHCLNLFVKYEKTEVRKYRLNNDLLVKRTDKCVRTVRKRGPLEPCTRPAAAGALLDSKLSVLCVLECYWRMK